MLTRLTVMLEIFVTDSSGPTRGSEILLSVGCKLQKASDPCTREVHEHLFTCRIPGKKVERRQFFLMFGTVTHIPCSIELG